MSTGRQDKATPFDPESLRQDWNEIIDSLSLSEPRRRFLRSRWLEYVLWMEKASQRTRKRYYVLRSVVAAGAVILPALVGLNVIGSAKTAVLWITFAISIVVGLAAALEGFFRLGERWRHYRKRVEELKAEGWRFYQLSGEYQDHADHDGAFPQFVANVELILSNEVDEFIAEIARAPEPRSTGPSASEDQSG